MTAEKQSVKYMPWTDGHAIGFRCELPDGSVTYIYLNPSTDCEPGDADLFVYQGPHGHPGEDTPLFYVLVEDGDKGAVAGLDE